MILLIFEIVDVEDERIWNEDSIELIYALKFNLFKIYVKLLENWKNLFETKESTAE